MLRPPSASLWFPTGRASPSRLAHTLSALNNTTRPPARSIAVPVSSLLKTREERFITRLRHVFEEHILRSLLLPTQLFHLGLGFEPDSLPPRIPPTHTSVVRFLRPGETDKLARLSGGVFGSPIRRDIAHLCLVHYMDGLRRGTASTKTRWEVKGSGRKLFQQKGTGRARVGDARSPIRRGGGVVFGPRPRDFSTRLPRKVRKMGMRVALSDKVKEGRLHVVESLHWNGTKTKGLLARLQELEWLDGKFLVVTGEQEIPELLARSSQNIARVCVRSASEVTIHDLLRYPRVVVDLAAVEYFESTLCKNSTVPERDSRRLRAAGIATSMRARRRVVATARKDALEAVVVQLAYQKRFGRRI